MTNFGQPQYGPPPQQYGPPYPQQQSPPQRNGAPQQYGQPQGGMPQQYGQQFGAQHYGAQPYGQQQWAGAAQPFPQPGDQQPWGLAPAQQQYDMRAQDRKAAVRQMAIGGVVALVGLLITIVTYRAASDGGHYVVAWGPAIFGLVAFVRGLVSYLKA